MKKALIYSILGIMLIIFIKYYNSNYNVNYKLDNYSIKTVYKDNRIYYEINDGYNYYNFDLYTSRGMSKKLIYEINVIEGDNFNCIYPLIKDINTYPLCYLDGVFTDYNLIDSELLDSYKKQNIDVSKPEKDFVYYNNLKSDEYVALWNYKGYNIMNGKSYKNIELFKKDKYDNSLAYLLNDNIYMANNDEDHEYTSLIKLNITNNSYDKIDIGYNIDFDSYFVGSVKNNIYIFDNKYSILYEFNTKKKETKIIGNNEKGFVKYLNGKFVPCSKTEYKIDKIKYDKQNSLYEYKKDNGFYKSIIDNKKITQKLFDKDITKLKEYNNEIFYSFEDSMYHYEPETGSKKIFYYYELSFNSNNMIFIYKK